MKIELDYHKMLTHSDSNNGMIRIRCTTKQVRIQFLDQKKIMHHATCVTVRSIRIPSDNNNNQSMFDKIKCKMIQSRTNSISDSDHVKGRLNKHADADGQFVTRTGNEESYANEGENYDNFKRVQSSLQAFFESPRLLRKDDVIYCRYCMAGKPHDRIADISIEDGIFFVIESIQSEDGLHQHMRDIAMKKTYLVKRDCISLTLLGSKQAKLPALPPQPIQLPIVMSDAIRSGNTFVGSNYRMLPWYDLKSASKLANLLTPLTLDNKSQICRLIPQLRISILLSGMAGSGRKSVVRSVAAMLGLNVVIISGHEILTASSKKFQKSGIETQSPADMEQQQQQYSPTESEGFTNVVDVNQNLCDSFERAADFSPVVLLITDFEAISTFDFDKTTTAYRPELEDTAENLAKGTRFYEVLRYCTERYFKPARHGRNNVVLVASITDGEEISDDIRRSFTHEVSFHIIQINDRLITVISVV